MSFVSLQRVKFKLRIVRHQLLFNLHGKLLKKWISPGSTSFPFAWAMKLLTCKTLTLHILSTFEICIQINYFRLTCGELEYYDKQYDRVTVKNERRLQRIDRIFHKVTTTDDPIIRKVCWFSTLICKHLYKFFISSWLKLKAMYMQLTLSWLLWCAVFVPTTAGT